MDKTFAVAHESIELVSHSELVVGHYCVGRVWRSDCEGALNNIVVA